jgi:RNA polymerase sigma-54 factor
MALGQSMQQRQLQRLSPQQIQLMKLLQIPSAQIEQRIKEELEENPALEVDVALLESDFTSPEEMNDELLQDVHDDEEAVPVDEFEMSNEELSEYSYDDEVADYKTRDDFYPELDNDKVIPIKAEQSLHEVLMDQLSMLALDERGFKIAEQIIGSLDDDGYLRRAMQSIADDLAFKQSMLVEEKEIEQILKQVQAFDPVGIAARDLKECLLIQLRRKGEGESAHLSDSKGKLYSDDEARKIAMLILEKYFEEFTRKHYDKIQKSLHLDELGMKEVLHQILTLNPKPGAETSYTNEAEMYIIPDFTVLINNGKLELTLNSRNAPPLVISDDYKLMLKEYEGGKKQDKSQKEAVFFIKQKIDSAKWFIEMILQRQQTLLLTMNAILEYQSAFFLSGDTTSLRPMILKDIAEKTNLDVSTVSRVANSKYVQTEFGTYLLKYFFSESLTTDSGEEVSTKEVKAILLELIQGEDKLKPLSDDELTDQLQEKGYNIARRTVAKYRELLNIPVARLRKEW